MVLAGRRGAVAHGKRQRWVYVKRSQRRGWRGRKGAGKGGGAGGHGSIIYI